TLQPRSEDVLGAHRLRSEALGCRCDLVPERECVLPLPEAGDRTRTANARSHAAGVPRGIPPRARESDPRSTQRVRAVLGYVDRRCEFVSTRQELHARWL